MKVKEIQMIGSVGTEYGVIKNSGGILTITSRRPGELWPHGKIPASTITIKEGCTMFAIVDKDYQSEHELTESIFEDCDKVIRHVDMTIFEKIKKLKGKLFRRGRD